MEDKMKRLLTLSTLLIVSVFMVSGVAFGWGSTGGDGSNYRQLQETAVFYNNSDKTLYHGDVVILDSTGTSGTTLGSYVTYSSAADSVLVVGVVVQRSLADMPVVVCTKGPALTRIDDSSDAVTTLTAVGTSGSSGATNSNAGGGTNLGIALEGGDGTDADEIIVWVDPTGAD
uniref:Uncharacterized protein n=1 Tax=viral metagenome TaxID=1070528 RepID=A0A6M3IMM5_9ZZZZ